MDEDIPRLLLEGRPGIGKTTVARRRPGIRVVQVTEATRDALPEQLMDRLIGAREGRSSDGASAPGRTRRPGPSTRSASACGPF